MLKKMSLALLAGASLPGWRFTQAAAIEAGLLTEPTVIYADQPRSGRRRCESLPPSAPTWAAASSNSCSATDRRRAAAISSSPAISSSRPMNRGARCCRRWAPQQAMRRQEDVSEPVRPAFDPKFEKQVVDYHGKESAGTIVVDTPNKFLFLVQGNGKALRYGIGVGRPGFTWSGVKKISAKKEWPDWTPPPEMLARRPDLPRHMEGGPENPLGARAMYLGSSLYRIHGSNEPWTIGTNVSSGCIRMRNEDVIDLYGRVNVGARVVVI